ncbi:hypothetical protein D9M71_773780 [compost metagenome]
MLGRGDGRVADDVIGEAGMTETAGITEPTDDHRRRAMGTDAEPGFGGVSLQIDQ